MSQYGETQEVSFANVFFFQCEYLVVSENDLRGFVVRLIVSVILFAWHQHESCSSVLHLKANSGRNIKNNEDLKTSCTDRVLGTRQKAE